MCGIAGILKYNCEDNVHATGFDLSSLLKTVQNRGQDSAKLVTQLKNPCDNLYFYNNGVNYKILQNAKGDRIIYFDAKGLGLIRDILDDKKESDLLGDMGVAAVRYGTTGKGGVVENIQPWRYKSIIVCENGDINNYLEINDFLKSKGYPPFKTTSDVETIARLFHYHYTSKGNASGISALKKCMNGCDDAPALIGGYVLLIMTPESLIAARDANGIRQLSYYENKESIQFLSESKGLWHLNSDVNTNNFYERVKELLPGEIIEAYRDGRVKRSRLENCSDRHCFFEYAYLSLDNSVIKHKEVGLVREDIGRMLAPKVLENIKLKGNSLEDYVVVPVLSSGESYSLGLAKELNLNYAPFLFKDRYALRTFIMDTQEIRRRGVKTKFAPSVFRLKDKNVIIVDDSIVRGNTTKDIIQLLKEKACVKNVHVVSAAPMISYDCYYAVDLKGDLIAKDKTIDEIKDLIKAASLTYGTIDMWKEALGSECYACVDGKYPTEIIRRIR